MDAPDSDLTAGLLAVRIKGVVDSAQLELAVGASRTECDAQLERLAAAGLLRRHERLSKYLLTAAGRRVLGEALKRERERIGSEELDRIYAGFMNLDVELKRLASVWQVYASGPPPILNDHKDPRYDERIIRNLVRLHHRVTPLLERLAQQCPRYSVYAARLSHALSRLTEGASECFTSAHVDSYHNVWFELHEDLLCTTDRQRTE